MFSPLVGNACAGDNFGECNADQEVSCYGIPLSVCVGLLGAHVSLGDARGPRQKLHSASSLATATPSIKTNAKGGRSSSMLSITRESRRMFFPLTESFPVMNTSLSLSNMNQTGATCGRPSG